jgi:uncharacterized glyoxalase superfamily protein PhnB
MSDSDRSVSTQVSVAVSPDTAFAAFTEELDLWWVRGPINHHAAGRLREMRCESGVGGRLLEVYDDGDDCLELARITGWEPGCRLTWTSSVDDVETEVLFEASPSGTTVRVIARIPEGGQDRGGTSWTRVVPKWFGRWCDQRERAPRQLRDLARLALGVFYERPAAASRWLAEVFGFDSPDPLPTEDDPLPETEYGHPWIEFRIGNSSLMIFKRADGDRADGGEMSVHVPWVYVSDIDTHYQRAIDGGARIVEKLSSPWGLPFYRAEDLEGRPWTFAQARPTM